MLNDAHNDMLNLGFKLGLLLSIDHHNPQWC